MIQQVPLFLDLTGLPVQDVPKFADNTPQLLLIKLGRLCRQAIADLAALAYALPHAR